MGKGSKTPQTTATRRGLQGPLGLDMEGALPMRGPQDVAPSAPSPSSFPLPVVLRLCPRLTWRAH